MTCQCSNCFLKLPDSHDAECLQCGTIGKTVSVSINDRIGLTDLIALHHIKTYIKRHPTALAVSLACAFASSFIGLFLTGLPGILLSLGISIAAIALPAATRIIEHEKRG